MNYLPEDLTTQLFEAAKTAFENSYAPYSKFPVGAAVLTKDGQIFPGANIENASFGLTICAERVALGNAIANGNVEIEAIAVYAPVDTISPCGACRQFIIEFGKDIIVIFKLDQKIVQKKISELLPFEFSL